MTFEYAVVEFLEENGSVAVIYKSCIESDTAVSKTVIKYVSYQ